jgi:hypothetical protein
MPELTQQQIDGMQPELRLMMMHSTIKPIFTEQCQTTTDPNKPLVSQGLFTCTGLLVLHHEGNGPPSATLCHLGSSQIRGEPLKFLNELKNKPGKKEAIFITGKKSMGMDPDPEAQELRAELTNIIPESEITIHPTIQSPAKEGYGVAYVPRKGRAPDMLCVMDYKNDRYVTPYFPFQKQQASGQGAATEVKGDSPPLPPKGGGGGIV